MGEAGKRPLHPFAVQDGLHTGFLHRTLPFSACVPPWPTAVDGLVSARHKKSLSFGSERHVRRFLHVILC
jgi:hypothetical protein